MKIWLYFLQCDYTIVTIYCNCDCLTILTFFSQLWIFGTMWQHNCNFICCCYHCISQLYDLIQWLNDFFLTIGLYLAVANQSLVFTIWPFDLTIVNLCLLIVTIYISHNVTLFLIFNVSHKYLLYFYSEVETDFHKIAMSRDSFSQWGVRGKAIKYNVSEGGLFVQ